MKEHVEMDADMDVEVDADVEVDGMRRKGTNFCNSGSGCEAPFLFFFCKNENFKMRYNVYEVSSGGGPEGVTLPDSHLPFYSQIQKDFKLQSRFFFS